METVLSLARSFALMDTHGMGDSAFFEVLKSAPKDM